MNKHTLWQLAAAGLLCLLAACNTAPTETAKSPDQLTATEANETQPTSEALQPTTPAATTEPTAATDQTPEGVQARIADFVNEVVSRPLVEDEWSAAQVEQVIFRGGSVWAKESSTARLNIEEKLLRVAPNTVFTLQEPGSDKLQVNLDDGRLWMNVEGMPEGEEVEVITPNTVASVRGTRFSVQYNAETGETSVSSQDGQVDVSRPDGTFLGSVTAGSMVTATLIANSSVFTMTYAENLAWGMAYGPDLSVIFPGEAVAHSRFYDFAIFDPAISGDGQQLLYSVMTDKGLSTEILIDLSSGSEKSAEIEPGSYGFVFAPTGQKVSYINYPVDGSGGETICQKDFEVDSTQCVSVPAGSSVDSSSLQWDPSAQKVLATNLVMPGGVGSGWLGSAVGIFYRPQFGFLNSSVIVAIDFANLTLAALPAPGPGAMNNPVWSPDQGQIAFLLTENNAESGAIYVADVSGLNARQVGAGAATLEDSLLWTPDGEWLVYSDPNGGLWRVRPDGSQQEQIGTYPVEEGLPLLVAAPTPSGWPLYYRMRPLEFFNGGSPVYVLPEPHAQAIYLTTATYGPIFAGNGQSAAFALLEGEYPTIQSSVYFLPANPAYFEP